MKARNSNSRDHWVYDMGDWLTHQEMVEKASFTRSHNVTWDLQMQYHDEGRTFPGPQYAFADPVFNKGEDGTPESALTVAIRR